MASRVVTSHEDSAVARQRFPAPASCVHPICYRLKTGVTRICPAMKAMKLSTNRQALAVAA